MKLTHHGLEIELPDDWWSEAGMRGLYPHLRPIELIRGCFPMSAKFLLQTWGQ